MRNARAWDSNPSVGLLRSSAAERTRPPRRLGHRRRLRARRVVPDQARELRPVVGVRDQLPLLRARDRDRIRRQRHMAAAGGCRMLTLGAGAQDAGDALRRLRPCRAHAGSACSSPGWATVNYVSSSPTTISAKCSTAGQRHRLDRPSRRRLCRGGDRCRRPFRALAAHTAQPVPVHNST
jgi:hypothetical protein